MKHCRWLLLAFLPGFFAMWMTGCSPLAAASPQGTATTIGTTTPGAEAAARAYLQAWKAGDYAGMYSWLTSISRAAISQEEFVRHYQGVAAEAALSGIDYEILSALSKPETAQVAYRVTLHSSLVGDIRADTRMNLSLEGGQWRVQWDDTLVLPQLKGSNYLYMVREGYVPARANIYDRLGRALVAQAYDATALRLYPDRIDPNQEDTLLTVLAELTGLRVDQIKARYANFPRGQDWYLPLGEVPGSEIASRYDLLTSLSGLEMLPYKARFYLEGGIAPHVTGYVGVIQAGEVEAYTRLGYRQDERVGRAGLEKWGEPYLAGKRGGALYVVNAQGQFVTRLAEVPAQAAQSIYTTLDRDFQLEVQKAIAGFRGAAVVLERDTGRILAMASSPSFDPNAFEPLNGNSQSLLAELNRLDQPLLNRATQGQYPPGSIFKLVTMAAALESGLYTPETTYACGHTFTEIPGVTLYDWTYTEKAPASGLLTLPQGLIRSCNPFFFHIGLDLFNQGLKSLVAEMGRGFGLGSPTGVEGIDEASGQVPEPSSAIDATNSAIGQGAILVTPLQVASYIAAIGNGGTLYRPQVVEMIAPPDGAPVWQFKPEARGMLPVRPETLQVIQQAMIGVVKSSKPRGTAYHVFMGLDVPVAGKTGTAQSGSDLPHAWFGGYTMANRPDRPDIAAVVVLENAGEGSVYAAPIFRRIVEVYFTSKPGALYPWESSYNVTRTPLPGGKATPTPAR